MTLRFLLLIAQNTYSFFLFEQGCVRELRCHYFHHEFVKRAIVSTMDKPPEQQAKVGSLLKHLHTTELLSSEQIQQGLSKVSSNMGDLALDAPCAPQVFEVFVKYFVDEKLIPAEFSPR